MIRVVIPPDAVTIYDYARRYSIARVTAQDQLDSRVLLGKMKKSKQLVNSRWVNYYWLVKSEAEAPNGSSGRRGNRGRRNGRRTVLRTG